VPNLLTKPITGTVVFDLETNGLLHNSTRIHCIALHWLEEDYTESFNDEKYTNNPKDLPMGASYSLTTAISHIEVADVIIGHNIINFDIPIIKKLYPYFNPTGVIIDTLLLSRLYHPNLLDIDKRSNYIPTKLFGRHSLEAYGHRLGEYKGDFGMTTDWKEWSQEMEDYCIQDVTVTKKLCEHFRPYLNGSHLNTK
tara:strand:+ start:22 stop:609 length:588 start_codon:yes stop_codon:yes gene_type:complete